VLSSESFANDDDFIVEFATVGKTKSGKVYHHLWAAEEIDALLKEHGLGKPEGTEMETS
jgi:20S proteasome subunit alpha 3